MDDRDAQFQFINEKAQGSLYAGDPVISTDTKKKDLVSGLTDQGTGCGPAKDTRKALGPALQIPDLGKAPHGVYLVNDKVGFVDLGTEHDMSASAVESIRRWWQIVVRLPFSKAKRLYIGFDGNCTG